MPHQHPTLTQIARDACGPLMWHEMRSSWAIATLARAPSVPLTWLCARLGLGPMAVTGLGALVALSLPFQAWLLPLGLAIWTVAFSGWLFQVLDCVDGTLARVTGRTSQRGADADFLVDMAQWGLLYLSLGLLADRTLDTGLLWTAVACGAAWGRLLARVIRDRLTLAAPELAPPNPTKPIAAKDLPIVFLSGLSGILTFVALLGDWIGVGVVFLAVYALLDVLDAATPMVRKPR